MLSRLGNGYASVTATLALVVALGGTAYAAGLITGADIKNGSIATKDLKKNAVNTKKVKNGSLLSKDFKAGQLPAGATGPAGPRGEQGAPGPQGPAGSDAFGTITYVKGPATEMGESTYDTRDVRAECPVGLVALGGGVETPSAYYTKVAWSKPFATNREGSSGRPDGWSAGVGYSNTPVTHNYNYTAYAWVICARAGQVSGP